MTKLECIREAKAEAVRFLKKIKAVEDRLKEDKWTLYGCKETGALRRASMDLSRALVELRKPRF